MPINSGQQNTEHHDEHGIEKPNPHPMPKTDAEHPGYEITDVNTKGVVVFMGGMLAFIFVFFIFCYAAGKALNFGLLKQDSDQDSRNPQAASASGSPIGLHRGDSMTNNPEMEQRESALVAQSFPTPRLDADDSNQSTADLHAREDLLLNYYTEVESNQGAAGGRPGTVRIPIDVAMQLLVKRGLPSSNNGGATTQIASGAAPNAGTTGANGSAEMTGDVDHLVHPPLTNGFARTSYELDQIEQRGQALEMKNEQNARNNGEHAKLEK
ncbi:hypothetical protein [Terriglobus aquaticus]|uniref:Uncharacterized protein n=1 Tax=Terriglobus aquaticus TaxID=940139 RepID=A0ABW9KH36_9BACT|nr:hypothetical protein [Terriglobus aquaticus]